MDKLSPSILKFTTLEIGLAFKSTDTNPAISRPTYVEEAKTRLIDSDLIMLLISLATDARDNSF